MARNLRPPDVELPGVLEEAPPGRAVARRGRGAGSHPGGGGESGRFTWIRKARRRRLGVESGKGQRPLPLEQGIVRQQRKRVALGNARPRSAPPGIATRLHVQERWPGAIVSSP